MQVIPILTYAATTALAHTMLHEVYVDGVTPGKEVAIRQASPQQNNSPVVDFSSRDMECNKGGEKPVANFIRVRAGQTVSLMYWHDQKGDDIVDGSHASGLTLYATPANDAGEIVRGVGWTKIMAENWSPTRGWPTDQLKKSKGLFSFKWPEAIPQGKMILRSDINALHEADAILRVAKNRGVQVYPACIQFDVLPARGGGQGQQQQQLAKRQINAASAWPRGIRIPEDFKDDDPGFFYNMYKSKDHSDYKIPGPPVNKRMRVTSVGFGPKVVNSREREQEQAQASEREEKMNNLVTRVGDNQQQQQQQGQDQPDGNNNNNNNAQLQSQPQQQGLGQADAALIRSMRQILCTGAA